MDLVHASGSGDHAEWRDAGPFPFERRREKRRPAEGSAMAAFYGEDGGVCLTRVCIVDSSPGGLGLRSPVEIDAGTLFTLYGDTLDVPRRSGIVARCQPDADGFRVGLECERRRAA